MNKPIDKIIARPDRWEPVGDGFQVYRYIPTSDIVIRRMSPFLVLDFNAEMKVNPSGQPRGMGAHPHKGFETVTISYKGSVAHHDSAGHSGVIHAGDVQWMTAGDGILHKEYYEPSFSKKGGPFEMIQLWVNLPKKDKSVKPHYQAITRAQMGKLQIPDNGGEVNVIAGSFNGVDGPASTYSPVHLSDIKLNKDHQITTSLPVHFNTALLLIEGRAVVNGSSVKKHDFVLFKNEGELMELSAEEDSVFLLLAGEPLDEPIASYGPFVMNTQQEILEAVQDFQDGKFGMLQ